MRALALLLSAAVAFPVGSQVLSAQTPAVPLTVDAIFAHGRLIGNPPDQLTWSPDGKHLTYLDGGELIDLEPGTGRPHVLVSRAKMASLDAQTGSEQDRAHRSRYDMASYLWAPDSDHLLFDSNGTIWFYSLRNGTGIQIGESGVGSGDDPKFSPDGKFVSFIRNQGLALIELKVSGSPTIAVAPAPNPDTTHGQVVLNGKVDWVYEEELDTRSNYFWSPDSSRLAYLQMNETGVPQYPIVDYLPTHATVEYQRYPQPGDPNPEVHVGVVSVRGGKTVWARLPILLGQDYIPRFGWADAKTLWVEVLTRDHKHREIYFADATTGQSRLALDIKDDKFLNDHYDVSVGDGNIVLTDWSSGYEQLYLYSYNQANPIGADAKLERQLTSGDFDVGEIYKVDHRDKLIDYASNQGDPLDQQLWQVSFGGERKQLSSGGGFHDASFAPAGDAFAERQSASLEAPVLSLCSGARQCKPFWQTHALAPYHLRAPKQIEVKAQDGTTLYGTLLLPEGAKNEGSGGEAALQPASVPLIVNPYGGPGEQSVVNRWSDGLLFDELLAEHGFAVLHADNRGMAGRGRAFAQAAYHDFGPVQFEDQLKVVDFVLAKYPQLDPKRLGFWGWSWGGTFTLYAMTHSDRFRAGVAVAPVTDWRDYDSIYTERYLGLPTQDPEVYSEDSVVNSAARLSGRLLLAHGTGDDNVHIENTVQFIQNLIDAGIPYDLQIFPRKTHSIAGPEASIELYRRILGQFEQYLMPPVSTGAPAQ